ncbi:MAG: pirin family protein [Phycisphaerales bacterium]
MITIRKSEDRGRTQVGWLDGKHTFSFGRYFDPQHVSFSTLRVINDDIVKPAMGFGRHPHDNMEIVTYVLDGALKHGDSLGTGSVIRPGEIQRMSAGSGIEHSEINASTTEPVRLLQIWIEPAERDIDPSYEQKTLPDLRGRLVEIASPTGGEHAVTVHTDARIFATRLSAGESASLDLASGRRAWVQVARGSMTVNGQTLREGDGAAIEGESSISLGGVDETAGEALAFDLP